MATLQIKLDGNTVMNMEISMLLFEYGIYAQEGTPVVAILSDGEHTLEVADTISASPEG